MTKAVVLLSGGQDSTTCLFWAKHRIADLAELHAVSVMYGQRHVSEIVAARQAAIEAGCKSHYIAQMPVFDDSTSALIEGSSTELAADGGLPDAQAPGGLPTSFVPGRNLLFLAAAAARAGAVGAEHIVIGVCQTDYSGYPDCRREFIAAVERAIYLAWPSGIAAPRIHTPLMELSKAQTVKLARELPGCWRALRKSITCYRGEWPGCGACAACTLRAKGFAEASEIDPARYAAVLEDGAQATEEFEERNRAAQTGGES